MAEKTENIEKKLDMTRFAKYEYQGFHRQTFIETDKWDTKVLIDTIKKNGTDAQIIVAMEELSELIKELSKHLRDKGYIDSISEEMADVKIMLKQLTIMFGNRARVKYWQDKKIERLAERLHDSGAGY